MKGFERSATTTSFRPTLIWLLLLSVTMSVVASLCSPPWLSYEDRCLLIMPSNERVNWYHAHHICVRIKAKLWSWNEAKGTFVADTMTSSENVSLAYWISMNSTNFKRFNGAMCPYVKSREEPQTSNCQDNKYITICERSSILFVNPTMNSPPKNEPCTLEACKCDRNSWKWFNFGKKFIKVFSLMHNFSTSSSICKQFGGNLLTIHDVETQSYMEELTSSSPPPKHQPGRLDPVFSMYWLGLKSMDGSAWNWEDGTILKSSHYSKWGENYPQNGFCAGVLWYYDAKWRGVRCLIKNKFICEAKEPCLTMPLFHVSTEEKPLGNNEKVIFEQDSVVQITCELHGPKEAVTDVLLACDWDSDTSNKIKTRTFNVTASMQGQQCVCRAVKSDGPEEISKINIEIGSAPRQRDGVESHKHEMMKEGSHGSIHFFFNANPKPVVKSFTSSGVNMSGRYEFLIDVFELTSTSYSLVFVIVGLQRHNVGSYEIILDNGISPPLELSFELSAKGRDYSLLSSLGVQLDGDEAVHIVVLLGVLLLVIILNFIVLYNKKGRERRSTITKEERKRKKSKTRKKRKHTSISS